MSSQWNSYGWYTSSSLEIDQDGPSPKRPFISDGPRLFQAKQLQGERHDGRSIPNVLYRFCLQGKPLELSNQTRARFVTKRIQQHLRVVSSKLSAKNRSYESMTPITLSIAEEATPDTAVQVELGLVYQVISLANGTVQSSLLYSFYTPLDFLEFPIAQPDTDQVDGPDPTVPDDPDPLFSSDDSVLTVSPDLDDDDNYHDEIDGTGTFSSKDGNPQLLMCLGVHHGLASTFKMAVDQGGEVSCLDTFSQYRPAQFKVCNDKSNDTSEKHIVSIFCLGLGPNKWFLAITKDRNGTWRFKAEEADMGTAFVPKDDKFHFILTLDDKGLIRFQAVAGDQRYLAFGSTGEQVKVTGKDVKSGDNSKQQQTLFSFSPV